MPLGLANHSATLSPYDPEWEILFLIEKDALARSFTDFPTRIEHIGSTAVPRLRAKPILDIGIAVKDASMIPLATTRLVGHGYSYLGFRSEQMGHVFVKEAQGKRTHCVHLLEENSPHWHDYLALRDRLRTDEMLRQSYENIKLELAERFQNDRKAYTAGKAQFIREKLLTPQ